MRVEDKFHVNSYSIEVYVDNKYKGCYTVDKADREVYGVGGRRTEVLEKDLFLRFKKKPIKAGTEIQTECLPVCGRMKQQLSFHQNNKDEQNA